ncbi:HAMP domain-containing histidine kinase [Bacillus sp. BRMEA1]|uniref:HAMP domain-containing sensor histidine kinase n=1 Tax=Neobacillus endophyticus TaxID=2738405 RepID=UPI0015661B95|nr:HAMP domain-containing sensor histidine kinase [Neobacillus endophyticus]NRD78015.1 HAMP domain-containing histidine kinase [Neobacillus endophyticus]
MIQSIYIKNCLNYFFVIIVSLMLSFFITSIIFQNQITKIRETQVIDQGKGMIQLYQQLGNKGFDVYLKSFSNLPYDVYLYNQNGLLLSSPNASKVTGLSKKAIIDVVKGNVYQKEVNIPHNMMIGLPVVTKTGRYALFIRPILKEQFSQTRNIILTSLFIVLLIGISLILITTRILVKPIVQITKATNELARGNFQIRLDVKSKDEIGQLAKSFNYMVKELNNTEQMRKDFVANVSHELQSPLTAIKGMTIALKEGAVKPEEGKLYLEQIELESERLSGLTKQLLNLSMLEANKSPFHPKRYLLDRQLRNQLVAMQSQWMERNIEIDFDMPKLEIYADESLMNQVWSNLYSNAIKYNWDHGKITVRGYDRENDVEVYISNTGNGIPEKDLPHVFERFYRGEKAHTRTTESYGLGLAVVKRIIELHSGTISVESAEGEATTFKICLKK